MRGDLAGILYEATRDDVEYVFDDSIRTIDQHEAGVDVSFDGGAPRRFDLVIGADGLHSNVRRLAFGEASSRGSLLRHEGTTWRRSATPSMSSETSLPAAAPWARP